MPELPSMLANVADRVFSKPATVVGVDDFAPSMRRVRFSVPALQGTLLRPGVEVEFRVDDTNFRHYTPAAFDVDEGVVDIVFYLHGHGPGSRWAAALDVGSVCGLMGPGGGIKVPAGAPHILFGDETCVGLFEAVQKGRDDVRCVVEVGPEMRSALTTSHPAFEFVERQQRGLALLQRAQNVANDGTQIILCGHAQSIRMLRTHFKQEGRVRRLVRTRAYWSDDKRGL